MVTSQDIQQWISAGIAGAEVQVLGDDGQHFEAVVVAQAFAGKGQVARHQLVYRALGNRMLTGEIHALSLKTLTPAEHAQGG